MNFFAHQELARKLSRRMLVLFTLAVVCIVAAVDLVVLFAFGSGQVDDSGMPVSYMPIIFSSVLVLIVIGSASLYRIATLRGGGSAVAKQLGATPVTSDTTEFAYRRLRNVVEEIAIASGVPVPEVFVLEDEASINAFASGYTPADAAITVTRGCLDKLTREELQGVIAHEFSHVLNGDMRLNIRLMGVAFGILAIATIGQKIVEGVGRSRSRNIGFFLLFGAGLFVVGYIGVFLARIIKASISRQREYLADASAVQFTRQTEGIAGALKKIGALAEGSKLAHGRSEEVAHMLFGDGVGYSAMFATHPTVVDRLRRLQPRFDPSQFEQIAADWANPVLLGDVAGVETSLSGFAPARHVEAKHIELNAAVPAAAATLKLDAEHVAHQVAHPDTADYAAASALTAAIPQGLSDAAHSRDRAMAMVLALVLSRDEVVRERQDAVISSSFDVGTLRHVHEFAGDVARLHPMQRLPLAAMAFPALRRHPRAQLDAFMHALLALIHADGRVTLAEYCLAKLVNIQVFDALNPAAARIMGRRKLTELRDEISQLLSILAMHGHRDESLARQAYLHGMHEVLSDFKASYAPTAEWNGLLDRILPELDRLAPAGKELVVRGLVKAISTDGAVSVSESELLRTVCAALHCPLPPLLHDGARIAVRAERIQ
jgi:Zn-dependent protease with chaperone function